MALLWCLGLRSTSFERSLMALIVIGAAVLVAPRGGAAATVARPGAATSAPSLRVVGNQLVNAAGAPVRIAGVNRSGTEYACAQGWGIFDGPSDDASIGAMTSWNINAVRVPLNEDCWLGINGVNPAYAGATYQSAVRSYVSVLQARGLDVILDLHWGAPGTQRALGQEQAPDADHATAFWSSVAAQYKGVSGIAYDLFNEPHDISWSCWLNGCTTTAGSKAVGVTQLINAVRGAGATQPVIAEGLDWGADLSGWLANRPSDPAGQLAAGWHVYNFSGCNTTACWNSTVAPVAQQVPVVATEVGENDCAGGFLSTLLPWAQSHGIGYLAWAWDVAGCGSGPSLITDYSGTPTAYGAAYKASLSTPAPPPPPPPAPVDPAARFDFEDGTTQGWGVRWGSTLAVSSESGVAASGSRGLALDISGAGYPAAGVGSGLNDVGPGTVVTYRVWAPDGTTPSVSPVVFNANWNVSVLASQSLASGWNTVRFMVPGSINGVQVLGLQINDSTGWAGRLVLDDITWQTLVFDFEDGTTQGWGVSWGSTLSVANESGTAFTGTHGLALNVSGNGYPAAGESQNVAGLTSGAQVTCEVWAPSGVSVGVAPMILDGSYHATVMGNQQLAPGWNTVRFTVPAVSSVRVLGLQVNDSTGWTGRLVLDAVSF
jgi:hypothetical protein